MNIKYVQIAYLFATIVDSMILYICRVYSSQKIQCKKIKVKLQLTNFSGTHFKLAWPPDGP